MGSEVNCRVCGSAFSPDPKALKQGTLCRPCEEALSASAPQKPADDIRIIEVLPPAPAGGGKLPWKWVGVGGAAAAVLLGIVILAFGGSAKPEPKTARAAPSPRPAPPPVRPAPPPPVPSAPAPVREPAPAVPESGPPLKAPPRPEAPSEEPVKLSAQEMRRQMDQFVALINLAGVGAAYCGLKGSAGEATQLRQSMGETQQRLDALVATLKQEGQNPYVDDTLRPADQITIFDNQKLEAIGREASAALLGTFVAQVKAGSRARVAVLRDGEAREFTIRFDERPAGAPAIVQVAGLIPGQSLSTPDTPAATAPPSRAEEKPAETPARREAVPAAAAASGPGAPRKSAVPDAAKQKEAEKQIKDVFKAEYAKRAPADVQALARKLLQQGGETRDDPVTRFVLLREARDLAVQAGDPETALAAIDATGRTFELDILSAKTAALAKAGPSVRGAEGAAALARAYLAFMEEAVAAGQYDSAAGVSSKAEAAARAAGDITLAAKAQALSKDVAFIQKEAGAVKSHRKTLEERPADPAANLAVGRFLCLAAGDWEKGLPMLAKGTDAALKALAERDLARPAESADLAALGDGWWDLSEKERNPDLKRKIRGRAWTWYERALPGLTGLPKARVENRLKETGSFVKAGGQPARTPTVGGSGGAEFEDAPKATSLLVGFKYTIAPYGASTIVKSMQPVFLAGSQRSEGKMYGEPAGTPQEIVAKPGYAVGGIVARGAARVDGFKVIFMRIAGASLEARDSYESKWFGGTGGGPETKLGGDGAYVIGMHGRSWTDLDCVGLVQSK